MLIVGRSASQASRGTPAYMAPELFQEGATQSTASDLWALGCVLYECAAGTAPFVHPSFSELVRHILHEDPASLPGASPEFSHLLSRLLDKNPATRMTWAEMLTHPFWQFTLPVTPMPPEPALERYIARHGLAPKQHEHEVQAQLEDRKASERAKMCALVLRAVCENAHAATAICCICPITPRTANAASPLACVADVMCMRAGWRSVAVVHSCDSNSQLQRT